MLGGPERVRVCVSQQQQTLHVHRGVGEGVNALIQRVARTALVPCHTGQDSLLKVQCTQNTPPDAGRVDERGRRHTAPCAMAHGESMAPWEAR